MHLFAYKPDRTDFLSRFTQSVMRGPSPLPAGFRELIAAFTSRRNDCLF
jgi:alkylhydroperoxidase family enzyme